MILYVLQDKKTKLFIKYYTSNGEPHIRYVDSLRDATKGREDMISNIMEGIRDALYNRTDGSTIPTPKTTVEQRERLENVEANMLITPLHYEKLLNKAIKYNSNYYGVIVDIIEGYNDIWLVVYDNTTQHKEMAALSEINTIEEIDLYDFLWATNGV